MAQQHSLQMNLGLSQKKTQMQQRLMIDQWLCLNCRRQMFRGRNPLKVGL
jgi:hypothetical protein